MAITLSDEQRSSLQDSKEQLDDVIVAIGQSHTHLDFADNYERLLDWMRLLSLTIYTVITKGELGCEFSELTPPTDTDIAGTHTKNLGDAAKKAMQKKSDPERTQVMAPYKDSTHRIKHSYMEIAMGAYHELAMISGQRSREKQLPWYKRVRSGEIDISKS